MKYKFINKGLVPRPFNGRVLRFNVPVVIDCELSDNDKKYLNHAAILYEAIKKSETKQTSAKTKQAPTQTPAQTKKTQNKDKGTSKGTAPKGE